MQGLDSWIAAQRASMVANWRSWGVPPVVAIEGQHVLAGAMGGPEGQATSWLPLANVDPQSALVQQAGTVLSLWVDPKKNNYVDLFERFLGSHCGIDGDGLTASYDVDHMSTRERAINFGSTLVRMFPIPKGPNRSHGAGYEKAMTASDIGRRRKIMKLMDEVSTMKFFGIGSPSATRGLTDSQRAHMGAMAGTFGLSPEQIEEGVNNLMGRAHGRK